MFVPDLSLEGSSPRSSLSQLIGSTLALEYMRAGPSAAYVLISYTLLILLTEYVAPLGSSSLVFNFLFARFLVGTPVTKNDIYVRVLLLFPEPSLLTNDLQGTIVVVLGVIGIVAFGSINSGLTSETDVGHITYLWRRGGWLGYFFAMSFALIFLLIFTYRLDWVLAQRGELASVPFSATRPQGRPGVGLPIPANASGPMSKRRRSWFGVIFGIFSIIDAAWEALITFVTDQLEAWVAPKDDTQIAWTLGIGWACCGGGLAGGCLVFAKAT